LEGLGDNVVAGLNLTVAVFRFIFFDDDVGGSVPSGTMVYQNVPARRIDHLIAYRKNAFLAEGEQGLETDRLNLFELYPATMDVRENDEIQITNPPNNWDYQNYFRVLQVMRVGFHPADPRGYILCSCKRSVEAHAIQ
jgi:hypothetical protein